MQLAQKFGRPIFTFIDNAWSIPELMLKKRGQGEAIARNLREMGDCLCRLFVRTGGGGPAAPCKLPLGIASIFLRIVLFRDSRRRAGASIIWRRFH